jgi:hypothetical protein
VIVLLRRAEGATITELTKATDWQPHSVRGFISGTLGKRLNLKVQSSKDAQGERRYKQAVRLCALVLRGAALFLVGAFVLAVLALSVVVWTRHALASAARMVVAWVRVFLPAATQAASPGEDSSSGCARSGPGLG